MVKFKELEVGQVVEHYHGFTGEVVKIEGDSENNTITIQITDKGLSNYEVGYRYTAISEYITKIVKPAPHKLSIDVEANGMDKVIEQAKELLFLAEDIADIQKEESVFEAELGNGIKFKGTKSDFEVFVSGLSEMVVTAGRVLN
ncbi:hypothetical protein PDQ75_25080 [Bacillus cereus group sp. Bc015]|uniref:hypothetical protein n=1 Tax=Bacillus cereus group sp. Bc015 TaxID=3018123 RepID=UPI0022E58770|nr:hypothetical protein [Bacillus cereus group sp. Bc015]MDA2738431.1 hypothetical protein [Bacillus cereus group sp. Bc015]